MSATRLPSDGRAARGRTVVRLGLACLVAGLGGCSRQNPPDPDLVARIGDREIRVAEFQDWMRRRAVGTNLVAKEALLEEMFDHFAAVQQAVQLGLDRDPALRRAWENLLVNRLREQQLEPQLTNALPTPEQLTTHYSNRLAALSEPELRRGAMLFAAFPAEASEGDKDAVRSRLAQARMRALEPASTGPEVRGFGALAVEFSEDPLTRYKGGDLGWLAAEQSDNRFDPAVLATLFSLRQTNEVSEVLETSRGCYLVKWLAGRPARSQPLESVRARLEHELLIENRRRVEVDWKQDLRSRWKTQVFPEVLRGVTAPASSSTATPAGPPPMP